MCRGRHASAHPGELCLPQQDVLGTSCPRVIHMGNVISYHYETESTAAREVAEH